MKVQPLEETWLRIGESPSRNDRKCKLSLASKNASPQSKHNKYTLFLFVWGIVRRQKNL